KHYLSGHCVPVHGCKNYTCRPMPIAACTRFCCQAFSFPCFFPGRPKINNIRFGSASFPRTSICHLTRLSLLCSRGQEKFLFGNPLLPQTRLSPCSKRQV